MSRLTFPVEVQTRIQDVKARVLESCTICGGTGYQDSGLEGQVHRCDCMVVFRYLKELIKAGLPKVPYWTLTLADLQVEDYIRQFTEMYISNMKRALDNGLGAVFLGPNGIGKTSLMVELGKEAIVQGFQTQYFTLTSYVDAVFSKNKPLIEIFESGDLLLIDELDKTNADRMQNKIDHMIDDLLRRMSNAGKSLILATNWSEADLASMFGQSTVSLLQRNCKMLSMSGDDYSTVQDEGYVQRLTEDFDYLHPHITEMAFRLEEAAWQK